jgi:putative endonuclease
MLSDMDAPHIRVGKMGEEAVANHLKRKGYRILDRNYRKKWGELDIVTEKGGIIHFVEVKTVSYETNNRYVSRETWMPEENVQHKKLQRLIRTIESWILEHKYGGEWQIDVASVWIDGKNKRGRIKLLENIVE